MLLRSSWWGTLCKVWHHYQFRMPVFACNSIDDPHDLFSIELLEDQCLKFF